ncbi:hypothetical protein ACQPW3_11145 [Actinosynnema sp. CA-248983]
MAVPSGYRFPIGFDDLFPEGFYVLSVERAQEFEPGKAPKPAFDKVSGLPVWLVQGTDPSAKGKNTGAVVKIAAELQPVPPEVLPGTPFRPAMFRGLRVSAYVRDGWIAYTYWAEEMVSAQPSNRSGGRGSSGKPDGSAGSSAAAA